MPGLVVWQLWGGRLGQGSQLCQKTSNHKVFNPNPGIKTMDPVWAQHHTGIYIYIQIYIVYIFILYTHATNSSKICRENPLMLQGQWLHGPGGFGDSLVPWRVTSEGCLGETTSVAPLTVRRTEIYWDLYSDLLGLIWIYCDLLGFIDIHWIYWGSKRGILANMVIF